ncbi:MAG: T9SS type A sorting domain-containing protein [Bacteroidota bacterium]
MKKKFKNKNLKTKRRSPFSILLQCLLILPLTTGLWNNLHAQCTDYPFLIETSGFTCGTGEGTFCLVTHSDAWLPFPNNTCNEYAIEISYPTLDFVYTDIAGNPPFEGFEEVSTFPTVLRHFDPQIIPDIERRICVDGFLTGFSPVTTFTLTIVHNSNPSDIIATTTFTLDQTVSIGVSGTPTNLSQWITPDGPLLTAADALNNGQIVEVLGPIVVDVPSYIFSTSTNNNALYNELIMHPGSGFTVPSSNTFGVWRGNVHGCDDTWDRILVQNGATVDLRSVTVSDADVAVEMEDGSNLTMFATLLTENTTGVGSYGTTPKNLNFQFFGFNNITEGVEGMHFESSNLVDISGNVFFQNIETNGIFLDNTDMNTLFTSFLRCETGINVATPNSVLTVDFCSFQDCEDGIFTSGTLDLDVTNSTFLFDDFGIRRFSAVENERSDIHDNTFAAVGTGIFANTLASLGFVHENNFFNNESFNVHVRGIGAGNHAWTVQRNHTLQVNSPDLFSKGSNVRFHNTIRATAFRNDDVTSNLRNFSVSGGELNFVGYNSASSNAINENVSLWSSPMTEIYCNSLLGNGMLISSNSAGADIRGNAMSNPSLNGYNLHYGRPWFTYANTGIQDRRGNTFDLSALGQEKAVNYSDAGIAQDNQYFVGFFNTQGDELYPFVDAFNFPNWFTSQGGLDYECPSLPEEPVAVAEDIALEKAIISNINILDGGLEAIYGAEIAFDAKLKLYRHLIRFQQVGGIFNTDMQSWYNTLAITDIAKFIEFERDYQTAVALSQSEIAQVDQLVREIKTLKSEINEIVWYTEDTGLSSNVIIDPVKQAVRATKLSELEQKKSALATLISSKRQQLATKLADLTNLNNSIGAQVTTSGANLKSMNSYLIQRYASGFAGFDGAEKQAILAMADQCVGIGGEAVYAARSLMTEFDPQYVDYEDNCIGGSQRSIEKPDLGNTLSAVGISPNPASDRAMVTLPKDAGVNMISVVDVFGKTILDQKVDPKQRTIELEVAPLASGIYYVTFDNDEIAPIKLMIAR